MTKRTSYAVHVWPQNNFRSSQDSQPNKKEKIYSFQNFLAFQNYG